MKDRLKLLLQEMQMTQAEFADYIGVGRPSITHIMTGRDKSSQTVVSKTLLKFPEINPMWLLKGEGEMYRSNVEKNVQREISPADISGSVEIQSSLFPVEDPVDAASQHVPAPAVTVSSASDRPKTHVAIEKVDQDLTQPQQDESVRPNPLRPQPSMDISAASSVVRESANTASPSTATVTVPDNESKKNRKLRKIVFFYSDRSFEEYLPED